jgi:hypothetical protein
MAERAAPVSNHEITHKEIYDRVVRLEEKVDRIDSNTDGIVAAFNAAHGAFIVLDWIAKVAKPILWLAGLGTAIIAAWEHFKAR